MIVSNAAKLGVAVMVDIAEHLADGPVPASDIQVRLAIGHHRVHHVLGRLHRCGLLRMRRGVEQAYVLNLDAACISIADIVFALDGLLKWSPRLRGLTSNPPERVGADGLWEALDEAVVDVLDAVYLSSLLPSSADAPADVGAKSNCVIRLPRQSDDSLDRGVAVHHLFALHGASDMPRPRQDHAD